MRRDDIDSLIYCSPFSSEKFCNAIDKYLDFQYIPCTIDIKDKTYFINLFRNKDKKFQIGAVGYGGIFPFPDTREEFKNLITILNDRYGEIVKMVFSPFLNIDKEFFDEVSIGYNVSSLETAILDLEKYKELSDSMFKGSVRTDIRYSIKNNVVVKECTKESEIEEFYIFYKETMDRVGSTYYTPIEMMKELVLKDKTATLLLAYLNDKIISGSIFIKNKNHVFYWINASKFEYRTLRGNYQILKTAIDKSVEDERRYFNFGYSHNENILKTKLGWGCNLEKYFILTKK